MLLGWVARKAGRAGLSKSVDAATDQLVQKLPAPLVKAIDKMPGDVARAGGGAIVAGSSVRSAGEVIRSASSSARGLNQRRKSFSVSDRVHEVRDEIAIESEEARRRIRSEMVRETHGDEAALDELLDLRPQDEGPLPTVTAPIAPGRRKALRPRVSTVARVQRSYRQATKPWDRAPRR